VAVNPPTVERFRGISAMGSDKAWAAGDGPMIWYTDNGGASWTLQSSPAVGDLQDVQFLTDMIGYAAGGGSTLIYTNNGGQSWTSRNTGIAVGINGIFFLDENTGWAVSDNGIIYGTTNGGLNWVIQQSNTNQILYEIHFVNANSGWTVGDVGTILHFSTPTGIEVKEAVVSSYRLEQNYPNPFNPSTVIKFQLPTSGYVTLKIYNVLGGEVASLLDGQVKSGQHEILYDAAKLPAGLYLYELRAGDFKEIRKMTLVK
jgi:photosystem II stability/assembly factor-like uncharacterized protein